MKKWSLVLGLLVLFASGVLVGGLGTALYYQRTAGYVLGQGPTGMRKMILRKLVRDLDLTESQRGPIEAVIADLQADLGRFRTQHQPDLEAIIDRGIARMRPLLLPAQQKKLDSFSERLKEHLNSPPRGSGHHGPGLRWHDRD